jgi:hypothetical protein
LEPAWQEKGGCLRNTRRWDTETDLKAHDITWNNAATVPFTRLLSMKPTTGLKKVPNVLKRYKEVDRTVAANLQLYVKDVQSQYIFFT